MNLRFATRAAALLTLLAPAAALGQVRGALPKVFTLPASTRAMALGNAYQPTARHSDGLFYNPALLVGSTGFGLDVQQWSSTSSSSSVSSVVTWFGGGAGVGLQVVHYDLPSATVPDGQDHLFSGGPVAVSERVASLGYAHEVFGVDVGVAGKLAEMRVGGARSRVALVDVGVARGVGPVVVGLAVQDLGDRPFAGEESDEDGGEHETPRIVLGAGAYGAPVGIFDVGFSAAVSRSEARTMAGGGLEVGYWPVTGRTFLARVGVQSVPEGSEASPFTFGLAFWGDDLRLEWAYQDFGGGASGTHRFGVAWH